MGERRLDIETMGGLIQRLYPMPLATILDAQQLPSSGWGGGQVQRSQIFPSCFPRLPVQSLISIIWKFFLLIDTADTSVLGSAIPGSLLLHTHRDARRRAG